MLLHTKVLGVQKIVIRYLLILDNCEYVILMTPRFKSFQLLYFRTFKYLIWHFPPADAGDSHT